MNKYHSYAVLGLFLSNLLATDLIFQFYLVTPKKLSLSVVLNYWYSAEQKTNDIITHYPSFFFVCFTHPSLTTHLKLGCVILKECGEFDGLPKNPTNDSLTSLN